MPTYNYADYKSAENLFNFYLDKVLKQSCHFTEMTQKNIGQSKSRTNYGILIKLIVS